MAQPLLAGNQRASRAPWIQPLAVGGGVGILLLAALVASFVPAARATRIEPIQALREE